VAASVCSNGEPRTLMKYRCRQLRAVVITYLRNSPSLHRLHLC